MVFLESGLSTPCRRTRVVAGSERETGLADATELPESYHLVCVISGAGGADGRRWPAFVEAPGVALGVTPVRPDRSRADWPRTAEPTCEEPILVASSIRYPCVSKGLLILPNC